MRKGQSPGWMYLIDLSHRSALETGAHKSELRMRPYVLGYGVDNSTYWELTLITAILTVIR
jgi:hypothetical protein